MCDEVKKKLVKTNQKRQKTVEQKINDEKEDAGSSISCRFSKRLRE